MADWKSGPGMIDEEEEGEFHCEGFDIDVAFSYIGDKVQSLLGHFQKDFEGGVVSAEILGAKYGGYGSFLPMHQRSPLSELPARVQTPKLPGSSSQVCKETCGRNASFPVHMAPPAPSPRPSMGLSQSLKVSAEDALVKLKSSANFDQVETSPEKVGLPAKKLNTSMKIRIKIPPSLRKQHDLGLTSSTSGDIISEECSGLQVESHVDSPANIIQMMTSFLGDGSMLLSPLCHELVNLLEEVEYSVHSGKEAAPEISSVSTRLLKTDVSQGKEIKNACKGENFAISENKREAECLKSYHDSDEKYVSGRVMKPMKAARVKKRGESTDCVKLRTESSYSVQGPSLENASDKSSSKYEQSSFRCNSAEMIVRNQSKLSESDISASPGLFKAGRDISEGRRVKSALSKSSAKVGLPYNSGEEGESTLARAVNKLSSEEKLKGCQSSGKLPPKVKVVFGDGGSNASKKVCSGKKVLVKNDLVNTSSDCKPSGVLRKKSYLETAKTKSMHAGASKVASTEKHYSGSLTPLADTTQPPTPAILSIEGITIVDEEWVACDNCEKWRLLPYGRKAPSGDWTCSMLDWLPGMNMNNCGVSEDETTQAVQTTYPPGTLSMYSQQTHADNNTNLGVVSASFNQSRQGFDSDHNAAAQVKKRTLKQKPIGDSMKNTVPFSGKVNLNQHSLQMRRTKASNQSVPGKIAKKNSDLKHTTNSATLVSNLTKRKNEHMFSDDTVPAKRARKESFQDADKMMTTKTKVSGELSSDNFQKSRLFNKTALKDVKKQSTKHPTLSAENDKTQTRLPDNGVLVHKSMKGRELVNLKRKSTNHEDSQHLHIQQKHLHIQQKRAKVSILEKNDGDFHRDKKSRLSHVEGKEKVPKRCEEDAVLNLKRIDKCMETDQRARKVGPMGTFTLKDVVKLKKDLGCEEPSTSATSSSSKISNSYKNKSKCVDVKSSPGVSVSSSPARIPCTHRELPILMESEAKMNPRLNHAAARGTVKKSCDFNEYSKMKIAVKEETTVLDFRETDGGEKSGELASGANYVQNKDGSNKDTSSIKLSDKNATKNLLGSSAGQISIQKCGDPCSKTPVPGSVVDMERIFVESRPSEAFVAEDSLKSHNDQNVTANLISQNEAERFMAPNKNVSNLIGSSSLKKAKDVLRDAEEHKKSGFGFRAAIKLLYGASLLEACTGENRKNIELNSNPLEIYATAAELCKTCACDYQKDDELAAAALAYKCEEVACMRIVQIKSSLTHKVFLDLQSSLHIVSQGESPSSSASDVDNLNNSAMTDKTTIFKGNVSHPVNHCIPPRNRRSLFQLLDFTKDTFSVVEATRKSEEMFTAACATIEDSPNKDAIIDSVKRVMDFSFEDVEEFVRLITLAFRTVKSQLMQ